MFFGEKVIKNTFFAQNKKKWGYFFAKKKSGGIFSGKKWAFFLEKKKWGYFFCAKSQFFGTNKKTGKVYYSGGVQKSCSPPPQYFDFQKHERRTPQPSIWSNLGIINCRKKA